MQLVTKWPFVVTDAKILRQRIELLEKRNLERPPSWLDDILIGQNTQSGVQVNEESSLKFSAVWSAVKLLSESAAQLPYQVFRRSDGGSKEIYRNHYSYRIIHERPNDYMSKFTYIQVLTASMLLWGNGYARIIKDKMERVTALIPIHPALVEPLLIEDRLFYRINGVEIITPDEIIHVMGFSLDGYRGKSPIQIAKENIGLGLALQGFGSTFFRNGINTETALQVPGNLTDEQYKRLQTIVMMRSAGGENAHKPMILEGGMTLKEITIPPDQAQFLESRNFQVNEIARIFNVPPHMIGDLARSTNNNIEHQSIEYVQYSLMPWIIRIEEEHTRKMIMEAEKPDVFIEANVDGLMRGDAQARAAYYKTRWEIGSLNANEIRAKENDNPYEGGDAYFVPVNYQTVERAQSNINQDAKVPANGDADAL